MCTVAICTFLMFLFFCRVILVWRWRCLFSCDIITMPNAMVWISNENDSTIQIFCQCFLMFADIFFSTVGGKIGFSWICYGVNGEQTCKSSYTCITLHWEHIQIRFDVKTQNERPLEASKLMETSWFQETVAVYLCFRLFLWLRLVLGLAKVLKLLVVRCSWA